MTEWVFMKTAEWCMKMTVNNCLRSVVMCVKVYPLKVQASLSSRCERFCILSAVWKRKIRAGQESALSYVVFPFPYVRSVRYFRGRQVSAWPEWITGFDERVLIILIFCKRWASAWVTGFLPESSAALLVFPRDYRTLHHSVSVRITCV